LSTTRLPPNSFPSDDTSITAAITPFLPSITVAGSQGNAHDPFPKCWDAVHNKFFGPDLLPGKSGKRSIPWRARLPGKEAGLFSGCSQFIVWALQSHTGALRDRQGRAFSYSFPRGSLQDREEVDEDHDPAYEHKYPSNRFHVNSLVSDETVVFTYIGWSRLKCHSPECSPGPVRHIRSPSRLWKNSSKTGEFDMKTAKNPAGPCLCE